MIDFKWLSYLRRTVLALLPTNPPTLDQNKHQRLAEISTRLEKIQQEQQELLQEAADIIATEKIEL
ncbi:hypothetical protein [Nodularia spumigena]|uniref:Uncharacterized protein n=1 Tax=Nodularia spumigena UHCC 0060 TaxID=3110300 RepID=A0ABU5UZ01_NODSP|nr:hypothetical protein [Nodularia spumigena]EAW42725.1 hypothetical protein N9414_21514 [Nodularia spumigena CCY9414]MEA5559469.1 hypothetical protein [Nodularia spumigena CH309]MEA5611043.1 hypothetical protein [Nodularia spumigena UHCC 0060]